MLPHTRSGTLTDGLAPAGRAPAGVSRAEGWWIVALAAVLATAHAVLFQTSAMEWGGLVRFGVLLAMLGLMAWLSAHRHVAEAVHPRGHHRALVLAGLWGVIVAGPAGWFWIAQPGGHTVAWPITTAVAVAAFLPLGWVGERLVRAAAR